MEAGGEGLSRSLLLICLGSSHFSVLTSQFSQTYFDKVVTKPVKIFRYGSFNQPTNLFLSSIQSIS